MKERSGWTREDQERARSEYVRGLLRHELADVVGEEKVLDDAETLSDQASDRSWLARFLQLKDLPVPAADLAVRPGGAREVAGVVRIASDYRVPVVPRGGGSGTQGGTFAPYGGISLDTTRMDRILDIDEESLVVTAEAGVDADALEEVLAPKGLTLAHDTGGRQWGATVGGWLASRGSGVMSTKYGKAEDMVLQAEAVLPPGKIISTLPVPSHAAGPGLLQMLVGSEGTLGVITSAKMRLDPIPESRVFSTFLFRNVFDGLAAGRDIMAARWRPAVMRLYDEAGTRGLDRVIGLGAEGVVLIVVCDGDPRSTAVEAEAISQICRRNGGTDVGPSGSQAWWEGRYEPHTETNAPAPPTIFGTTDACCTFGNVAELYRAKKAAIEEGFRDHGARYTAHFSHWYPWGAMIYDRFYVDDPPDDPDEAIELHDRLWDAAVRASLRCGAVINDHHGIGVKLGRFMREQHGEAFTLLQAVKAAWDPDSIMNPGKLGFGPPR